MRALAETEPSIPWVELGGNGALVPSKQLTETGDHEHSGTEFNAALHALVPVP